MENVNVGNGVVMGFNGDVYPYYIVDVVRGKYSYNKNEVIGLWVVPAASKCIDYYDDKWEVEEFNVEKHNINNKEVKYLKRTRKNKEEFTESGRDEGEWNYRVCEKPWRQENPSF